MNTQEVFNRVVKHLRQQGMRSMRIRDARPGAAGCAYRGDNGTMCAVGCLIADEHYNEWFEGTGVCAPDVREALFNSGVVTDKDTLYLLTSLQQIHDGAGTTGSPYSVDIERGLRALAASLGLAVPEVTP